MELVLTPAGPAATFVFVYVSAEAIPAAPSVSGKAIALAATIRRMVFI
ncbi:hypothetical protein AB0383_20950 [Amycolatopsis sp. NPDC051373]